jgi:dihydropteroate synthase
MRISITIWMRASGVRVSIAFSRVQPNESVCESLPAIERHRSNLNVTQTADISRYNVIPEVVIVGASINKDVRRLSERSVLLIVVRLSSSKRSRLAF